MLWEKLKIVNFSIQKSFHVTFANQKQLTDANQVFANLITKCWLDYLHYIS